MKDIQDLIDEMRRDIKCLDFFNNHDWEGDYSWIQKEQHEFVEKVKKFNWPNKKVSGNTKSRFENEENQYYRRLLGGKDAKSIQ